MDAGLLAPVGDKASLPGGLKVRYIGVYSLGFSEIFVTFSTIGGYELVFRVGDRNGIINSIKRNLSDDESRRLDAFLVAYLKGEHEPLMLAEGASIDSENYIFEAVNGADLRVYYRGGFSANNAGDLGDLRDMMYRFAYGKVNDTSQPKHDEGPRAK